MSISLLGELPHFSGKVTAAPLHLCLITLVPAGPAGESAEQNPASEPEGDAGGK